MRNYLDVLPTHLRDEAYLTDQEAAWPRQAAQEVLDFLTQNDIAVLGGEVWLPTTPGPTLPGIYTFEVSPRLPQEPWRSFVHRANALARHYVQDFVWATGGATHHNLKPYFNFAACDEADYPRRPP